MHSLLENGREYSLDELAFDFLDNPKNSVYQLGLFLALREDSFWFKHNRNLTYTPRTSAELKLLQVQLLRQREQRERAVNIQKWISRMQFPTVAICGMQRLGNTTGRREESAILDFKLG